MPLAITLRFDPVSASSIEAMWRTLAAAGIDADRHQLSYAPHITLAIYADDAPVAVLREAVEQIAGQWDALPISLVGFGCFPGPPAILWAVPVMTRTLLARHAAMLAALPDLQVHPHYRVDAWVPHVTLSGALHDPMSALAAVLPIWRPLVGQLDQMDLVRFRPVKVLRSHTLRR